MSERDDVMSEIWSTVVNASMAEHWIENTLRVRPGEPFGDDETAALRRLLDAGVSRRDLSLIVRKARYEAAVTTLYLTSSYQLDPIKGMHESLLSSDPSGREGRAGSAPAKD
jgi:hypothetical protein